jgi:uncharacterized protein
MKCPACFNELRPLQVGPVTVDVCQGGCGGIWFDAFELQRVDEQGEAAGEGLLDIQRDPTVQVDASRKRDCPRCAGVKLKRRFFSAKRQVEVDECPGCGGYWLDAGELQRIREETEETRFVQRVREHRLTGSVVRYLYQLRQESRE